MYCESGMFPNINKSVQIALTFPITSTEAERSFSAMRRLLTWLRSTMGADRLSNLGICHLHRDRLEHISVETIRNIFISSKARRLEFKGSIYDFHLIFQILDFPFYMISPRIWKLHLFRYIDIKFKYPDQLKISFTRAGVDI